MPRKKKKTKRAESKSAKAKSRRSRSRSKEYEDDEDEEEELPRPWLRGQLDRVFRPAVLLRLALAASIVGLVIEAPRWMPNIDDREEYLVDVEDVVIDEIPRWVPRDFVHDVLDGANLRAPLSILDPHLNNDLVQAFQIHPWVAAVERVEKTFPGKVTVELRFRRPVAMVQVHSGVYPVDGFGVLLPPDDFSPAEIERFPLIREVDSTPQGPAGTSWGDVTVLGSALLAAELLDVWDELAFAEIVVERPPRAEVALDELHFHITTRGGSRVVWGRIPGSDHPGELTAQQKVGRLKEYLARYGAFDHPHGPYEIDIRHWREISRRPLVSNRRLESPARSANRNR